MWIKNRYAATPSILFDLGQRSLTLAAFKKCTPRRPSAAFAVLLALATVSILTCCCCCLFVVLRAPDVRMIIESRINSDIDDDDDDDRLNRSSLLDRLLDEFNAAAAAKRQNRTPLIQNHSDAMRGIDVQVPGLSLLSSQTARQAMRPKNSSHSSSSAEGRHSIHSGRTTASSFSEWLLLQVNRTAMMLETCATLRPPKKSADVPRRQCGRRLDGIFVDKSRRILYCAIPKVATSSVKLAMALMTGRVNRTTAPAAGFHYGSYPVHSSGWLRSVGIFSLDYLIDNESRWLKGVWPSLRKFIVVRHPLERLVSAYVDKFTLRNRYSDYFQHRYGRRITRMYRNNVSAAAANSIFVGRDDNSAGGGGGGGGGHDVSFREFVRFLSDRRIPCVHRANPHWMAYHDLCHPCFIDYDFVVHFENLADEMRHLWRSLYRTEDVDDVLGRRNAGKTQSRDLVGHYVSQLPDGYLSGLYDTYELDFRLFMYSL